MLTFSEYCEGVAWFVGGLLLCGFLMAWCCRGFEQAVRHRRGWDDDEGES